MIGVILLILPTVGLIGLAQPFIAEADDCKGRLDPGCIVLKLGPMEIPDSPKEGQAFLF